MKSLFGFIVLASFLTGVSATQAQFVPFSGAGARAMGNGGAFIGNADDATAIYWNPAGLTQLKKAEISAAGIFTNFRDKITDDLFEPTSKSNVGLNFGSLVIPLSPGSANVVLGFGRLRSHFSSKILKDTEGEYVLKSALYNTMVSMAVELGAVMSVGITANLIDGKVIETNDGYQDQHDAKGSHIFEGKAKYSGPTFLTYGVLVKLGPPIRVGGFLRQPMKQRQTGESGVQEGFIRNVIVPGSWGLGTAIRGGDNFTFSVDLVNTRWSRAVFGDVHLEEREIDSLGFILTTGELAEDQMSVRLGMEFLVNGAGLPMPVRIGTYAERDNLTDFDGERVKTRWWTFGIGALAKGTQLDFAALVGTRKVLRFEDIEEVNTTIKLLASLIIKFG